MKGQEENAQEKTRGGSRGRRLEENGIEGQGAEEERGGDRRRWTQKGDVFLTHSVQQ